MCTNVPNIPITDWCRDRSTSFHSCQFNSNLYKSHFTLESSFNSLIVTETSHRISFENGCEQQSTDVTVLPRPRRWREPLITGNVTRCPVTRLMCIECSERRYHEHRERNVGDSSRAFCISLPNHFLSSNRAWMILIRLKYNWDDFVDLEDVDNPHGSLFSFFFLMILEQNGNEIEGRIVLKSWWIWLLIFRYLCNTLLIKSSMSIWESKRSIKMKMKLKLWISRNVKIKRF